MNVRRPPVYKCLNNLLLHDNYNRHALLIFLLSFICYALFHASRKPISVVKSVLHAPEGYGADTSKSGWAPFDQNNWSRLIGGLEYMYLLVYSISMIGSGYIAERVNLRYFLSAGMILSGLTNIAFGSAMYFNIHKYSYFAIVQLLSGVFQSTGWPIVITLMGNWWGKSRRGLVMGLWNAHTSIGNIIGSLVAGYYVESDWGASFAAPGVLLIIGGLLVYLMVVDHPDALSCFNKNVKLSSSYDSISSNLALSKPSYEESKSSANRAVTFLEALLLPHVLSYSAALFFAKLVSYTFLYWLPNYLTVIDSESITEGAAARLSTIFDVGGIFGGIIAGLVSDTKNPTYSEKSTIERRAMTCAVMLAIAAPLLLTYQKLASASSPLSLALLFCCGVVVNGPYALITTAVSADLGTQNAVQSRGRALATITAIVDSTGSLGAALGPFLTGLLVPYGWSTVFTMLIISDILSLCIVTSIFCGSFCSTKKRSVIL